jgi:hypothetical protein
MFLADYEALCVKHGAYLGECRLVEFTDINQLKGHLIELRTQARRDWRGE